MLECAKCRELERELEKAALEYWRLTLLGGWRDEQVANVAKNKMLEVQKRFNDHKLSHENNANPPPNNVQSSVQSRDTPYSMDKLFTLTRDNIIAECVDADEKPLDRSERFDSGTVLTIIRPAHPWGNVKGIEYCTVQIDGRDFNVPAPVVASSILPKSS